MGPADGLNQRAALYITFTLTPILFSFVIIPISFVQYEGCDHCDRVIYTGEPVPAWHRIRWVRSLSHSRVTEELWLGQKASYFSVRVRLVAARLRLSGSTEGMLERVRPN